MDGYRIVLAVDGEQVHYHGSAGERPERCDAHQPPGETG